MGAALLWAGADVRRRWPSLVLLAIIVAVAVGAVLALVAGARRADHAIDRYFNATEIPEVLASSQGGFTPALMASLAADRRIARVEQAEAVFIVPEPMEPLAGGFMVIGTDGSPTGGFGRPPLLSGRYWATGSTDEIIVSERAASTYDLHAGQQVRLMAIGCLEGCPPEPIGDATIVGVVRLPTDLIGDPSVPGIAFADPALLEGRWRRIPRLPSWLGVHLHEHEDTRSVVADMSVRVDDGDVAGSRATLAMPEEAGRRQGTALMVAAAAVALAGAVTVTQAVARHLAGRWADASVLGAMGVTTRQRTLAGALAAAPALGAGLLGAIAFAIVLSPLLPLGIARQADPDIGLHVDAVTLVPGGAIALAILIGFTAVAARRWARPPRLMASTSAPSIAARLTTALGLGPVGVTGSQFALDPGHGASRRPVIPTLLVLTGVTTVVIGALVVRSSLDGLIASPDRFGQAWDLKVNLAAEDLHDGARRLAADPRVRDVTITRQGEVNLVGQDDTTVQTATTGIRGLAGAAPVAVLDGRAPAGPREIALASGTMEALGLGIGDRTTANGPCGTFEVEVTGRVIVPLTANNYPDDGSIITLDAFDELCAHSLFSDLGSNQSALVRLRDPGTARDVRTEWQAQGLDVTDRPIPASITSIGDIRPVPAVVTLLAGLLGTAAAGHALLLAVDRRQRDIAVLRAVGLRPRQAGRIVVWQSATLALVAVVIGLPFGLVLGRLMWTAIAQPSNVLVHIDVNLLLLAAVVAATAVIAAVLSIWPSHRAARLRMAAILRSE